MREDALSDLDRLAALDDAERSFQMTEEAFGLFYARTARPVWAYLARLTGDARAADDLLQEAYYRLLRASVTFASDDHRRHYLFRVATNLARDHRRRLATRGSVAPEPPQELPNRDPDAAGRAARQIDLQRALQRLRPRERSLLWLAYAQGCTHAEIAAVLGVRVSSLKALLFRARRRLLLLLDDPSSRGAR